MLNWGISLDVYNCTFSENAGGLYTTGGVVSKCIFTENIAPALFAFDTAISDCVFDRNSGDGKVVLAASRGSVSNCTFTENIGSALGAWDTTVSDCVFERNSSEGTATMGASGGTVSNCAFTENRVTSLIAREDCIVSDCTFSGNMGRFTVTLSHTAKAIRCTFRNNHSTDSGGAIFAGLQGSQRIEDCVFVNNRSEGVGGAIVGIFSVLTVINCVFSGNSAALAGGAIAGQGTIDIAGYPDLGRLRVLNSTFYGNSAPLGGAISLGDLFTTIQNSILWGNGPDSVEGEIAAFLYSVVEGGSEGTGNIDADPLFVDAEGGDFRLRNDSPAIDTASAESPWSSTPVPDVDIDGVARPQGLGIDMGAYESESEKVAVETTLSTHVVGMGSIDPSEGNYSFAEGSTPPTVTLTAPPAEDWQFLEWQGALTGSDNPAQLEMGEDRDLTAVFEEIPTHPPSCVPIDDALASLAPTQNNFPTGTFLLLALSFAPLLRPTRTTTASVRRDTVY